MAYRFTDDWAEEIWKETSKARYQRAVVRITDPSLETRVHNEENNTWTVTGDSELYEGQARVIGVRWGTEAGGESQANATTLKAIRVQLPHDAAPIRVRKNVKVWVVSAPDNPVLTTLMFTVTSDFQGSTTATRTFEAALDGDVAVPDA